MGYISYYGNMLSSFLLGFSLSWFGYDISGGVGFGIGLSLAFAILIIKYEILDLIEDKTQPQKERKR